MIVDRVRMVIFLGLLVKNPQPGHSATDLAPNLKRFEYQSHVVFYVPKASHILVVHILHQRMD